MAGGKLVAEGTHIDCLLCSFQGRLASSPDSPKFAIEVRYAAGLARETFVDRLGHS